MKIASIIEYMYITIKSEIEIVAKGAILDAVITPIIKINGETTNVPTAKSIHLKSCPL